MRRVVRYAMEIAFLGLLVLLVTRWQTRNLLPASEPAPPFALRTLDGRTVKLSDMRGKTTLLHFWATWCGVCRGEFSTLKRLAAELDEDQALLTIVADSAQLSKVQRLSEERGLDYPILLGTEEVLAAYRVNAFPTNYFVSPDGHLKDGTLGFSTRVGLATRLRCAGP